MEASVNKSDVVNLDIERLVIQKSDVKRQQTIKKKSWVLCFEIGPAPNRK
jgi:hypothetical protein